jgi:hypothetical protein
MTSSVGWLVLDLLTARLERVPPFISVDCPWGYEYDAGRFTDGNQMGPKDTSFLPCLVDGRPDPKCHCGEGMDWEEVPV